VVPLLSLSQKRPAQHLFITYSQKSYYFMLECQIQTGIFVLKACGKPSECSCNLCGKHICYRHSRHDEDPSAPKICLECYTQKGEHGKTISRNSKYRDYDFWYFNRRNSFFQNHSHHRPFNEDDYNNFERENQADFDDHSKTGNFFDS
jgi:hypothetical protein